MGTYLFQGKIRPEWISLKLDVKDPPLRLNILNTEGGSCTLILLLGNSDISLVVSTTGEVLDIPTFRNQIITATEAIFDACVYLTGKPLRIEITSVVNLSSNEFTPFDNTVEEIANSSKKRPGPVEHVINFAVSDPYLRGALSDLHQAIVLPNDTGIFCYRAVERLMISYRIKSNEDRDVLWGRLRSSLHVRKTYIDPLTKEAELNRHGELWAASGEERVLLMERAWIIVDRYIEFLMNNKKELPEAQFPFLKD